MSVPRPPVLAGSWYPADPDELATLVDRWLAESTVILGFPFAPIEPVEDLIENANRVILGNPRFQRFRLR